MTAEESTQLALLTQAVNGMRDDLQKITTDYEMRLRKLESEVTTLKERLTLWQVFQMVFSTTAAGIVAAFRH